MARLVLALALVLLSTAARAATITGRVVEDGFRVAEYGVFIRGQGGAATLVQDGEGRFTLRNVPPGFRSLTLVGWAFTPRTIDIDIPAGDSQVALGTIAVEHGRALAGHVVDASGDLVAGATVIVFESRPINLDASPLELMIEGAQLATTRADGTYTVHGLPEDPSGLRVLAFGDDMISAEHLLGSRSWTAELAIGRPGKVVGRVTNRRQMKSPIVVATPAGFEGKPSFAGVSPSGELQLELPAGVYDLGFPDETAAPLQIVVVGDRTRRVTLTAPTAHVDLVIESSGCTYVRLLGARPGSKTPRTELGVEVCLDDRTRFTRLPPGPYRVCVDTDEEDACSAVQLGAAPAKRVIRLKTQPAARKSKKDDDWTLE